jgi:hypothetical protein
MRQELKTKGALALFHGDNPVPDTFTWEEALQRFNALPKDLQETYELRAQIRANGMVQFIKHIFEEKRHEGMSEEETVRYAEREWVKQGEPFRRFCVQLGNE